MRREWKIDTENGELIRVLLIIIHEFHVSQALTKTENLFKHNNFQYPFNDVAI